MRLRVLYKLTAIIFVFIVLLFTSKQAIAQLYNPTTINPKATKLYAKAMAQIRDVFYTEALTTLHQAIEADPHYVDAYLSLAGVYGELKAYDKAVTYYKTAIESDSDYCGVYRLPYSINLAGIGRFSQALQQVNKFLAIPNVSKKLVDAALYRQRCYQFAVDYAAKHPQTEYGFFPINLGDSVNTERSEYYPTLSISDSLLVFTRMSLTGENFVKANFTNNHFSKAEVVEGNLICRH